jgi:hypothetical protein
MLPACWQELLLELSSNLKSLRYIRKFFFEFPKLDRLLICMTKKTKKIQLKHETHRHVGLKFGLIVLIFVAYFGFVSFHYGVNKGLLITWLTWSFFVLCTPIADAGFLIDFPVRILFRVRMLTAEVVVWALAIGLNVYAYLGRPDTYEQTKILALFRHILEQPVPFWLIILFSGIGTFLSIKFGDELLDVLRHKDRKYHQEHHWKWKAITMAFVFAIVLVVYDFLLKRLGIDIPL